MVGGRPFRERGAVMRSPAPMPRVAALVAVLAALWSLVLVLPAPVPPPGMVVPPWWAFLGLFLVADSIVVTWRYGREDLRFSVVQVPLMLGLFCLPAGQLLAARVLATLLLVALVQRSTVVKVVGNAVFAGAQTAVTAAAFHLFAGSEATRHALGEVLTVRTSLSAVGAPAVAGVIDWAVLVAISGWFGTRWNTRVAAGLLVRCVVLPGLLGLGGPVACLALCQGPGALVPTALVGVTLLAGTRAFAVLQQRHDELARIHALSRELHDARELAAVARVTVAHTLESLRATWVELELPDPQDGGVARPTGVDNEGVRYWSADEGGEVVAGRTRIRSAALEWPLDVRVADQTRPGLLRVGPIARHVRGYGSRERRLLDLIAQQCTVALRHASAAERLQFEAGHDPLTGLPNRGAFRAWVEQAVATADAEPARGCLVGILDLNDFKTVNDSLGHFAGDAVIAEVGRRLDGVVGVDVQVGRLGGDEFGVLITGGRAATPVDAVRVARELLAALAPPVAVAGEHVRLGASIGLARAPLDGREADAVLHCADLAMYAAKRDGGGVRLYSAELVDDLEAPLVLAAELRVGLARGEVGVVVQPLVDLVTGRVHSAEALARWQHRVLGMIEPELFVNAAERGGLVDELTAVVLDDALAACARWRATGLDVPVAVNLGAATLSDPGLPDLVAQALARHGLPGTALTLELTESGVLAGRERVLEVTRRLRALGVRLAVDDFGTGYSSMTYLSWLGPDQLKIDKSFVQLMRSDSRHAAIVRSIIDLAGNLGIESVAEGVLDAATAKTLVGLGCHVVQGFLVAEPMAPQCLPEWAATLPAFEVVPRTTIDLRDGVTTSRRRSG